MRCNGMTQIPTRKWTRGKKKRKRVWRETARRRGKTTSRTRQGGWRAETVRRSEKSAQKQNRGRTAAIKCPGGIQ
ncbi:hypothetical protein NDU88_006399 [Pleurodeles waltl]|uniref:Uncharacterized protein n=1 Tax=Pleurodeles waltl TaxID=8319 RepID=A0AAV7WEM1_PLEWA|nr:hypothetical protein NDU88_006399 [Pleurodeles waltl]